MADQRINNLKLGIFTIARLIFLVITLYMIGKDQNLFGSNIVIHTRLSQAGGLVSGNNVRYSGIQVGTVSKVQLISDTIIEIQMLIDKKAGVNIRNNAVASIGTEGLIGNRVVNLMPGDGKGRPIKEGDYIQAKKTADTEAMLETLSGTNVNVAEISQELLETVKRINASKGIWQVLDDETLAKELRTTLVNIRAASEKTHRLAGELSEIVNHVKSGEGSAGQLLYDTSFAAQLSQAVNRIDHAAASADSLLTHTNQILGGIQEDINTGKGPANALLKDSAMVGKLHSTLTNMEKSTRAFHENMEALKHNFLFRGYFRKQEKLKSRQ